MIDTDKYEGHDNWEGTKVNMANEANKLLIADAPLLLEEVKRLRKAWKILRSKTEMSCVCFAEYPDKQDINTHELMDLAMKEAIE